MCSKIAAQHGSLEVTAHPIPQTFRDLTVSSGGRGYLRSDFLSFTPLSQPAKNAGKLFCNP
jgi:hypothetical protein